MRATVIVLGAALLIAAGVPMAAAATTPSPGVHIDPGSPVAKQYAIPLASARGGGSGSGGGLFGRGITRAPARHARARETPPAAAPTTVPAGSGSPAPVAHEVAPRAHHAATRAPARHARHPQRLATTTAATTSLAPAPAPASAPIPAASYSPTRSASSAAGLAWMLGIAALVLTVGGLGGAALARYGRRTSASAS